MRRRSADESSRPLAAGHVEEVDIGHATTCWRLAGHADSCGALQQITSVDDRAYGITWRVASALDA